RDDALWRRVLKIPFEQTVPPERRDPALKRVLTDPQVGGPAVLAWAVRGCLEWQRVGLDVPGVVASATDAYRRETDSIAAFIAEAIVYGVGAWSVSGEVWEAYVEFCEQLGYKPESRKALGVALSATGAVASAKRVSGRS